MGVTKVAISNITAVHLLGPIADFPSQVSTASQVAIKPVSLNLRHNSFHADSLDKY